MNSYEELANAIIVQAATDYRKALRDLKTNPKYSPTLYAVSEVERFFHSDWYKTLTSVSGELLIKKLRAEVAV